MSVKIMLYTHNMDFKSVLLINKFQVHSMYKPSDCNLILLRFEIHRKRVAIVFHDFC